MSLDFRVISLDNTWDFITSTTDIEINNRGDIETVTSWEKCEQDFVIAVLTEYDAYHPIAPQKGSILPAMLGAKFDKITILPLIEVQISESLGNMEAEQLANNLPLNEVIDLDTLEIYSNYPLDYVREDKRVLTIYIKARTQQGTKLLAEYPFNPPGLQAEITG